MTAVLGFAVLLMVSSWVALGLMYRRQIAAAWNEPVLRTPVLIIESDDWGYGPLVQADRLDRIAELLSGFEDNHGRHPIMTLGVVLGGPDTDRMRASSAGTYYRLTLEDDRLAPIRDAMARGARRGVYALQLHGMEHYWPDCLMRAATADTKVRNWLTEVGFPATESLPPPLQSRWIDGTTLPSMPLPTAEVGAAATEEAHTFFAVFSERPVVAVPPTFIWTDDVEVAWAAAGVQVIVTPGRRCESRDRNGDPASNGKSYFNGATGSAGLSYIVRNSYFEPSMGHTHERAIQALEAHTRLGRPTLLETHRMNFVSSEETFRRASEEMMRLFQVACARFRNIRFMTTAELAQHYRQRSELVDTRVRTRTHFLLRRLAEISRLRKMAWLTAAIVPAWAAYRVTGTEVVGSVG